MSDTKTDRKLFRIGIGGAVITAICCFTPLLVVVLGIVGLSAWLGWIDYVLFPALFVFIAIIFYALIRRARRTEASPAAPHNR